MLNFFLYLTSNKNLWSAYIIFLCMTTGWDCDIFLIWRQRVAFVAICDCVSSTDFTKQNEIQLIEV